MVSAMFVFANSSSPATLQAYSPMAASNLLIYLDGKIVPESEAKISVFDHGLLYGDGCFEGIRIYNGRVFRLTEHLVRLYESARSICLTIPISLEEMEKATVETVAANNLRDGYIRLLITRGVGPLGLNPYQCPKAGIIITVVIVTFIVAVILVVVDGAAVHMC